MATFCFFRLIFGQINVKKLGIYGPQDTLKVGKDLSSKIIYVTPAQTQRDYCQGMETFRRVVTIFKEHGELHSGPMQCIKRENLVSDPPLSNVSESRVCQVSWGMKTLGRD